MTNNSNRKIAFSYAAGGLLEILSAASLTAAIVLLVKERTEESIICVLIAVLLFLLGVASRFRGGALEARAEEWREKQDNEVRHEITAFHLKTLQALGVEADILEDLDLQLGQTMSAKELIQWLESTLGPVRAQEKLEAVLRYTRTTQTSAEPSKPDRQGEQATASSEEEGPTTLEPASA